MHGTTVKKKILCSLGGWGLLLQSVRKW